MAARKRKVSQEEQQFTAWLDEAMAHGLVDHWSEQPYFELINGMKCGGKFVHRPHNYTADFVAQLTDEGERVLRGVFQKTAVVGFPNGRLYVDTKGGFMNRGAGQEFSINQKLVYERHGVWVSKVVPFHKVRGIPKGLFVDTWCPDVCAWNKASKHKDEALSVKGGACQTVEYFLAGHEKETA